MTNIKLLKIMELIDEKLENITDEKLNTLPYGDGLLSILEQAIDEVLWDEESIEQFWSNYQHCSYDGTPSEALRDYEILEKYFFAKLDLKWAKIQINGGQL